MKYVVDIVGNVLGGDVWQVVVMEIYFLLDIEYRNWCEFKGVLEMWLFGFVGVLCM